MESFIEERYENGYYISSWKTHNPLPDCLKTISSSEFESLFSLYISLRNSTLDIKQKEHISSINKSIETEYKNKVLQIEANYNYKMLEAQKEISLKEKKISQELVKNSELQESYNILHKNFSNLQDVNQKSIDKEHNFFLNQIESLRKNFTSIYDISQKNVDKEHIFFVSQLENIKLLTNSKDQQISELKQELLHYKNQSLIQQNSSKKGKQGEMKFFNLVNQYTCWSLEDTSGLADAGDFQGTVRNCKIFIDTKTYGLRGVPKCEIDKFKRNMESNKDIPIGLLISMESKIIGGPQDSIYCEINSNNQLLLYIQNFLAFDHESIFYILNNFIDLANFIYTRSEKSDSIDIEKIKPTLNSLLKISQDTINKISNIKESWVKKINTDCNELKNSVTQSFNLIKEVLQTLFPETNMIIEDSEGEKNKSVKRKKKSTTPVVNPNE